MLAAHQICRAIPVAILAFGAACSAGNTITNPDYCNVRIVDFTPGIPTMRVGDTLTVHASYTATPCAPDVPASSLRWTSSAPQIVSVDSLTGKLTAHGAGSASLDVHLPGGANRLGAVGVTVSAP